MASETVRLAEYAAGVHYDDLPPQVVQRAKDCITDRVAVIVMGNAMLRKQSYGNYPAVLNLMKSVYEGVQVPMDRPDDLQCAAPRWQHTELKFGDFPLAKILKQTVDHR